MIFSPHTTAGFTINENADPDVVHDMLCGFEKVFPAEQFFYQHAEGNSHAHMKTTVVGPSQTLIIMMERSSLASGKICISASLTDQETVPFM